MVKNIFFPIIMLLLSSSAFGQTLILSDKLQLIFDEPQHISHTAETLIIEYEDWTFTHELVNPKNIYQGIDLTGVEQLYLTSIFNEADREKLPKWLKVLSEDQASIYGIEQNNIEHRNIGDASVFAVCNSKDLLCHTYIFENLKTHHLVIHGDESKLIKILEHIGVR